MSEFFYPAVSFCLSFFRGIPGRQLNSGSLENIVQKELYGFQMFALRPDPDRAPFRIQMISGHEDTVADIDSDRNRICAVFLVVRDGVQKAVFVFFADPGTFVCIEVQEPSALPQRSQIVRFHSHCVKDPDIGESNEDLVIFISCRLVFSIIEPGLVIEFDQLFRQVITAVIDVSLPESGEFVPASSRVLASMR